MEDTESILLSGDIFTLETEDKKVNVFAAVKGTGTLYRDSRPLCIEGDEEEFALLAVSPVLEEKEEEEELETEESEETEETDKSEEADKQSFSVICGYTAGEYTVPGQGEFKLDETSLKNKENLPKAQDTFKTDDKKVLLAKALLTGEFTVSVPARKPAEEPDDTENSEDLEAEESTAKTDNLPDDEQDLNQGKPDPDTSYKGTWTLEPFSKELEFNENLHNEEQPEFLITGDMPVMEHQSDFFQDLEAKTGKIKVMPNKDEGALKGTSDIFRDCRAVCLEKDWENTEIGAEYCIKEHTVGGEGTITITGLADDHESSEIKIEEEPILMAKIKFKAEFKVTKPAEKIPGKNPDPVTIYYGEGYFAIVREKCQTS